jgi:pimeloyl-ACP methyl ester carboxylesterase
MKNETAKTTLDNGRGYVIPCLYRVGEEKRVCVVLHGLGSSKESPTVTMLFDELPKRGIGVFSFDFPAHGESLVDGDHFRIENCVHDIEAAVEYVAKLAPGAEIVFFASSFGAYALLLCLAKLSPADGRKPRAFLRSAAVSMPGIFQTLPIEARNRVESDGFVVFGRANGYYRPLKVTKAFCQDLAEHDVFELWRTDYASLRMIHGERDETIPLWEAQNFADRFHIPFTVVKSGDHRLFAPGVPEQVLSLAAEFFTEQSSQA